MVALGKYFLVMLLTALFQKLAGLDTAGTLLLQEELDGVTVQYLQRRLASAYPPSDEFIVIVSSLDKSAVPDACFITTPALAADC